MRKTLVLALLIMAAVCSNAPAALILQLELDEPIQIVGPNDTVSAFATITNLPSSDEIFFGDSVSGLGLDAGSLFDTSFSDNKPYLKLSGLPNTDPTLTLFTQFFGKELEPGESLSFLLATFIPAPSPVPSGTYWSSHLNFSYNQNGQTGRIEAPGDFVVIVPVPEPSVLSLAGIALVGILVVLICRRSRLATGDVNRLQQ